MNQTGSQVQFTQPKYEINPCLELPLLSAGFVDVLQDLGLGRASPPHVGDEAHPWVLWGGDSIQ